MIRATAATCVTCTVDDPDDLGHITGHRLDGVLHQVRAVRYGVFHQVLARHLLREAGVDHRSLLLVEANLPLHNHQHTKSISKSALSLHQGLLTD